MSETTDTILSGLRGQLERLLSEARDRAKADQQRAIEAMRAAAAEQMQRIDKRIDALSNRHSLEPALWGAAGGVVLVALALIFGVWLGDHGVPVRWLITFGWRL